MSKAGFIPSTYVQRGAHRAKGVLKTMSDRLYIGIDLGTYQSTIMSSGGSTNTIETVVGRPKDPVARNFLGCDVLFGEHAVKHKLACNIFHPLAHGVAQDDEENLAAAKAFVTHLIDTVDADEYDEVLGVICSPSHITFTDKSNLVSILRGQVNAIMVVSEPFAVAFGLDEIGGSIVADIGAGTTDIARIYGTFPTEADQITFTEAGDWLDHRLMDLIDKKYAGAQLTQRMVRIWKEENSYVGDENREVLVDISVEGKKQHVDIGDVLRLACNELIPFLLSGIKEILTGADPEYQAALRNNIILAGGVSGVGGLAEAVANGLADVGGVSVWCAKDPHLRVADGALKLAQSMPDEIFTAID